MQLDTRLGAGPTAASVRALLTQVLRSGDTSASIRRTAAWGAGRYVERADVTTALARRYVVTPAAACADGRVALGGGDDTPTARAGLLAALGGDQTRPCVRPPPGLSHR
ncbi:MAG: hypothetical protein IPG88_12840 [Gemmatimonadetes bacterium]|nr:hypothetical protein [Gemmatimonadota bacterium]